MLYSKIELIVELFVLQNNTAFDLADDDILKWLEELKKKQASVSTAIPLLKVSSLIHVLLSQVISPSRVICWWFADSW